MAEKPTVAKGEPIEESQLIANRYRIESILGRGGMGTVYRVIDLRQKQRVALKRMIRPLNQKKAQSLNEMFSREFRTLTQIAHPSVIRVFESGVDDGVPYYTMEFLEGNDLHEMAPIPWRQACAYLRDVSSCLALLHSRRLLHRDITPRNIRCDKNGRAKLFDFGTMLPMGARHSVVGTPPLIAPEVLHQQAPDIRCDLYALGGTLYWALTGRYAYPARNLEELWELYQIRPKVPSSIVSGIPKALDALVFSLIAQEADARPRSAAEVMERLTAIASLEEDESLWVSLSYLTTPSLVGRETQIKEFQDALSAVAVASSSALFITGKEGVGRTRMLDACVVEAHLMGARVLRLQAMEIGQQNLMIGKELLTRVATAHLESLSIPALPLDNNDRRGGQVQLHLLTRLQTVLHQAIEHSPVLIAIDDVQVLDPESQAMLATLLHAVRGRLLILLTVPDGSTLQSPLDRLRLSGNCLLLQPLDFVQTQTLLGSVFGEVPRLQLLAAHVHDLSAGNPRAAMQLVQHLVDQGQARYEMGGWCLPTDLQSEALPESWGAAWETRLQALSADERDLAEILAITIDHVRFVHDLDRMTLHGVPERRAAAYDGLVALGILRIDGDAVAFDSTARREHLKKNTSTDRRRKIYQHLAFFLEQQGHDELEIAAYLLRSNQIDEAIDRLISELSRTTTRWNTAPAGYAEILQSALEAAKKNRRCRRDCFILLRELVTVGEHMDVPGMNALFDEVFEQLTADACLTAYLSLPDSMDPGERLSEAFQLGQARYDALPEHQKVYSPVEGVRELALAVRQAAAFANATMDQDLLDRLPTLAPFVALSPAIEYSVKHALPANGHINAARLEQAYFDFAVFLARLREPDHAGLSDEDWLWTTGALEFAMGHLQAGMGIPQALAHADVLEQIPAWAITAWDVRCAYYLRLGNAVRAEICRNRMELEQLSNGRKPPLIGTSARLEMDIAADAGDLVAARRAMERMQRLIKLHPGYRVYEHYGPAVQELIRGNYALALEHAIRALEMTAAGRHPSWPWIANCHLGALLGLARYEEAYERATALLSEAEEQDLRIMAQHVSLPLALAEAHIGRFDRAVDRVQEAIAYRENLGCQGLNLGWAYEHRARIAIVAADRENFALAAKCCANEYGRGRRGSTLFARYEALRREARQAGLETPSLKVPKAANRINSSWNGTGFNTIDDILSCLDLDLSPEQAERLLELLLAKSGAVAGLLYRLSGTNLMELAAKGIPPFPPPHLDALLEAMLDSDPNDKTLTCTIIANIQNTVLPINIDDDDTINRTTSNPNSATDHWQITPLGYFSQNGYVNTGVLTLYFEHAPVWLPVRLLEAVGQKLGSTVTKPKNSD